MNIEYNVRIIDRPLKCSKRSELSHMVLIVTEQLEVRKSYTNSKLAKCMQLIKQLYSTQDISTQRLSFIFAGIEELGLYVVLSYVPPQPLATFSSY